MSYFVKVDGKVVFSARFLSECFGFLVGRPAYRGLARIYKANGASVAFAGC